MEPQPHYRAPDAGPRSRFPEEAANPAAPGGYGNGHETAGPSPMDALKDAGARLGELKEYAAVFVGAKVDGIKVTLRNLVLYAVLGVVGAVVGVAMLVTATVMMLYGLAGMIGEIFPEPYEWWAGRLIVGLLLVGGTFAAVILVIKKLTGSSRKRTIEKYENRKRDERNLYGHDVAERAREQARREEAGAA